MSDTTNSANVNNVNTNSIALFSAEGNMLKLAFKNETLIVSITPKVIDDGKPRWPKDLAKSVLLRPQVCAALYEKVKEYIFPCIQEGKDYNGYVTAPTNREMTNLIGFGFSGGRARLGIFLNVGADRRCSDVTTYIFDTTAIIKEYDAVTGNYTLDEAQSQFHVILLALDMAARDLSGACGHSSKIASSFNTNQIISFVRAIATKIGATPAPYGNYNGYRGDDGSYPANSTTWTTGSQEGAMVGHSGNTPDVQQVNSLDSLVGEMSGDLPF